LNFDHIPNTSTDLNDQYKIELTLKLTQYGVCDSKVAVVTIYEGAEAVKLYPINPEDIPNATATSDGFTFTLVMSEFGTYTAVVEVGDGKNGEGDSKATI
jgi:hypothetical protein